MNADANEFLAQVRWTWSDARFAAALADLEPGTRLALGTRACGAVVTDHRSSWVRRQQIGGIDCYVKTYDYPTLRAQLRGIGRNTCFAPSRPMQELRALRWLAHRGLGGPAALGVAEVRRYGLLRRAILVTEAWPGEACDTLWPRLTLPERAALRSALESFVVRLHATGFRDRNLDPRNLLVHREADGSPRIVKIDSPRFRISDSRLADDRLARADRTRLARGLAELDAASGTD